jgi:hypothetical protein
MQCRRSQHTCTHPYEYTYANPNSMSTSEALDKSEHSRSHQLYLIVDGNTTYNLTHNPRKYLALGGYRPTYRSIIGLQATSQKFMTTH